MSYSIYYPDTCLDVEVNLFVYTDALTLKTNFIRSNKCN
jgi:hypothetical protein